MKVAPRFQPIAIASILFLCQGVSAFKAVPSAVTADSFERIGKQVADNRQRHRETSWSDRYRAEERRLEQQREEREKQRQKEEDKARAEAERQRMEGEWTDLQSRYNAIDVKLVLEQAKADFCLATNLLEKESSPEIVVHTNRMVKLTRQLIDAQSKAKGCFNRNLVLSEVKPKVVRFEKATTVLVQEMDAFKELCYLRETREQRQREWDLLYGKQTTRTPDISEGSAYSRTPQPKLEQPRPLRSRLVLQQPSPPQTPTAEPRPSTADKLRELKKLFDEGVLTQEEYDQKRKELLSTY